MTLEVTENTKVVTRVSLVVGAFVVTLGIGAGLNEFRNLSLRTAKNETDIMELRGGMVSLRQEVAVAGNDAKTAAQQATLANITLNDIAIGLAKEGIDIPTDNEVRRRRP